MTIDDASVHEGTDTTRTHASTTETLAERLRSGEPYALAFGGQGLPWLSALADLVDGSGVGPDLQALVDRSAAILAPVADELVVVRPHGFAPVEWANASEDGDVPDTIALPDAESLVSAPVSVPAVYLTHVGAIRALAAEGLDVHEVPPTRVVGHSQGVLAAEAVACFGRLDAELLAVAELLGAAAAIVGRRRGLIRAGGRSPMLSVSGVDAPLLAQVVDEVFGDADDLRPRIAIRNARNRFVVVGRSVDLDRLREELEERAAEDARLRDAKLRGGSVLAPVFEDLDVEVGFHHPAMTDAVELVRTWAAACGLDDARTVALAKAILVAPVDWPEEIGEVLDSGAHWILDMGPGEGLARLDAAIARGSGLGVLSAGTRRGQRNLFTPGAAPAQERPWSVFTPHLVTLPDGSTRVETAFTRLTGRSPILLAGMTPTTVDPAIVAAAANAGHWAELAGGGQVTPEILAGNLDRLAELLEPGRAAQFNSLFLDPYLWKMQIGGKRLVQRHRAAGAPIDGVIVTAGIPELDEAVALIEELVEAGIPYVAFKPGTIAQIRQVVRIATEAASYPVIVQVEGGRAGGHHSWEDLDDLLIATYGELRSRPNVVLCVGGGIGTPERAADYLGGRWAHEYGLPAMPVDGILVGTAAMATLEATTSPQVKQLLVDTEGVDEWVGAGRASGGMASGRSQLGADLHEIDNSFARCGRLLDEVAGDAEAVESRREEIIEALSKTAKPYFGDVAEMTYAGWLRRYLELAVGDAPCAEFDLGSDVSADCADAHRSVWADVTWRDRFVEMLRRGEARLADADHGEIETLFPEPTAGDRPHAALAEFLRTHPDAEDTLLHPADVAFFLGLCRTPGKPANFVPVLDGEVRRWWRSDSLWQAHDAAYAADAVCVIPGPVAVAGITRVDEPVGELLDRFEAACAERVAGFVPPAAPIAGRRRGTVSAAPGIVGLVLDSPDAHWAGRQVDNPVWGLGEPTGWIVDSDEPGSVTAVHGPTGARLVESAPEVVDFHVPIGRSELTLRMSMPASTRDGGAPIIADGDAATAMAALLRVAAGVGRTGADGEAIELPSVVDGAATWEFTWDPALAADHTGVTSATLPSEITPAGHVPDALVGACWPSVFAAIGEARTENGAAVVEGLLDLVHLDHTITFAEALPGERSRLASTARVTGVSDTDLGRVVGVEVEIRRGHSLVATLTERFAIRGRNGAAAVADPAIAEYETVSRRRRRELTLVAPHDMTAFAKVSGDHNPIHVDAAAAALAGLPGVIVHGMWLSAAAQHVVCGTEGDAAPVRISGWTARMLGMVLPGARVDVRVDRVGRRDAADVLEVTCRVDGEMVMTATAFCEAPRTAYAFPGQGIQSKGMGMEDRARSAAAREVWDRADAHTREALGFSILAVVRDNPTELKARGTTYRHPDGVLFLTQFTQVAMATLGVAQVAQMREAGVMVEGSFFAGHSVGEYNALAAVADVLPLEAVLEIVFHRGQTMHELVPRDAQGRSNYRLAAIRPSQFGVSDSEVTDFVAKVAEACGEFLEIVNFNLAGSQYAIAGTVAGCEALERECARATAEFGGRGSFVLVPGIDVPFHSTVLRDGVDDFRAHLEALLPAEFDHTVLHGRYIPNLVPKPFTLDRAFVEEIADLVPSAPLADVLADWDTWAATPMRLARVVLIELLAWQFASPVRWIETQALLFGDIRDGGLGVERFVEIGVRTAPTVANLASKTLDLPGRHGFRAQVLNAERDAATLYGTDTDPAPVEDTAPDSTGAANTPEAAPSAASAPAPAAPAPAPAAGTPTPEDIAFSAADATLALVAQWTKVRPEQITGADSIETLVDGVSSRRNQLLLDLGTELGLGAIDGAAEADVPTLVDTTGRMARGYRAFGPVLADAFADALRRALGPSGKRPAHVTDRVTGTWGLGSGWAAHVTAEIALGTRDGVSVRGGDLGGLVDAAPKDAKGVDAMVDAAVQAVAARRGIAVALPTAGGAGGATVDAAALGEFAETITGPEGVLASTARHLLERLGHVSVPSLPEKDEDAARLAQLVADELGSDWPRLVAPAFDERRSVRIDDRWASAREDLARLWVDAGAEADLADASFHGTGEVVAAHARWWANRAEAEGRGALAARYAEIAAEAEDTTPGVYAEDVAVVTGASAGSIAAAVVAELLAGGATVVATTSRLDDERLAFYKDLYRGSARDGAELWVVPANMASYADVDALVAWIGGAQTESVGGRAKTIKPALTPTLLFPFAAPRVAGSLADAGPRAEAEMKVLLWSVERLVAGLSAVGADTDVDARLHVVLPGSPNRGLFGGDGAYGESKAALDALVARWSAEKSWSERVTLVHALIGWVRGTGLMGHNDPLVEAVEAAGVSTWSTTEMAHELLRWCAPAFREAAASEPVRVDLTGGLADAGLDMAALAGGRPEKAGAEAAEETATIAALPNPPRALTTTRPAWAAVDVALEDMVVVVGAAELGPWGSSRTRFEAEVTGDLSAAGVVELAWSTGLITWENEPRPAWIDTASGEELDEAGIFDRYHDEVLGRCGVRRYEDDGELVDNTSPELTTVYLDRDLTFAVADEAEARTYIDSDPAGTVAACDPETGEWTVTRKSGTSVQVPRRMAMSRFVGGQIPQGFDPSRWGLPADMLDNLDRVSLWNLVTTVDAFVGSGFTPAELLRHLHPSDVANTQGTGLGAMESLRTMYIDGLLGNPRPNDILQEALPNVIAAHVMQSYVGGYGAMVHPVAACATAAVSVEEGVDKIRVGKAGFVVAGGFDDLSVEGILGFGAMAATADSQAMRDKGIADRYFSRANDRRRGGFVESQGGGTVLLARGDIAADLGLPVLGVVGYAASFADGAHTSIPAPGIGALGAGRGGTRSRLARELARLGVGADDIAVVSKHDTSTNANDPNESELHSRLAEAIGRGDGNPLYVVSQKTLTGHAKGGAAAFQLVGLCQVLRTGILPPNRALDCVDDVLRENPHLVWLRRTLEAGDLKAGLLTSLGFGHVSGMVAIVHPEAFVTALAAERGSAEAERYREESARRELAGVRRISQAMHGGASLFERPENRRLGKGDAAHELEAAMLIDEDSRLGAKGVYETGR